MQSSSRSVNGMASSLTGVYILPSFSIRAVPIPPITLRDPEQTRNEKKMTAAVDAEEMIATLEMLKANLSRLSEKRATGGKGKPFSAPELKIYASKLGIAENNKRKNDLINAIKTKMEEMGYLTV